MEDDADVFAKKNIANKLRKVKDPQVRALAEFEIENTLSKYGNPQSFISKREPTRSLYASSPLTELGSNVYELHLS